MDELLDLTRHAAWADGLVWDAVEAVPEDAIDDRTRELLHHIHEVQWAYLRIWRGEPLAFPPLSSFPDLAAIRAWGRDAHAQIDAYLRSLSTEDLERTVDFPWAAQLVERFGEVKTANLRQAIQQVILHSMYHRGQVNARLRQAGGEPPLVDFIAWIWMGRP